MDFISHKGSLLSNMHIIFTGFHYPSGMAGTKRNEHAIRVLAAHGVTVNVLVSRQSTKQNHPIGNYSGVQYATIMPDTLRTSFVLKYPFYFLKAQRFFKKVSVKSDKKNTLLYIYGPPNLDNLPLILSAKKAGYLVVFDVVEDFSLAFYISKSYWHRIKNIIIRSLARIILKQSAGIIVISSHLKCKVQEIINKKIPVHVRPISVDFSKFSGVVQLDQTKIDLFYSGSFGKKDGVGVLIEVFEKLAQEDKKIRLLMTGKSKSAGSILEKIERSRYKDRIIFLGYLSDHEYYSTVMKSDILCVPRIDIPYAHAGFPFKLGEFLATGKPVVVSRTGDVGNYLKNLESAVLVEPGSVESICEAVNFLINNPDVARRIGKKGKDTAIKYFDHIVQGEALFSFLSQLCSEKVHRSKQ